MKYLPLNLELMATPVNWFIVWGILAFAGIGLAAIVHTPTNT
jgi:hypothetical protein